MFKVETVGGEFNESLNLIARVVTSNIGSLYSCCLPLSNTLVPFFLCIDCYVAATGMPDPRKDHAVQMCRFAKDIMKKMRHLTKELEVTLGPDTGDLSLRVGIHSGPVTAGVLRGEKARFQLFGDTMNTVCTRPIEAFMDNDSCFYF